MAPLPPEFAILIARGFSRSLAMIVVAEACDRGVAPGSFALDQGLVSASAYYCAVAEYLGVPFLPHGSFRVSTAGGAERNITHLPPGLSPDLSSGLPSDLPRGLWREALVPIGSDGRLGGFAGVPAPERLEDIRSALQRAPGLNAVLKITTPHALAHARQTPPQHYGHGGASPAGENARQRLSSSQRSLFSVGFGALFIGWLLPVSAYLWIVLAIVAITSLGFTVIRFFSALGAARFAKIGAPLGDEDLPHYSVLVPLYYEAGLITSLVRALKDIDYPRDKLQVLFLLEEDDQETLRATRNLPDFIEVVIVGNGLPKTKPRALCHGLRLARGALVTVYDAEDRPDPDQLRKAAALFARAGPALACLQARLAIDHVDHRFMIRQFAFEYAALFDRLLPWLSARNLAFPLGGTSNHFRRTALERANGWDAYNVTEDADLAIRLKRLGYDIQMMDSTTWEEAPVNWHVWFGQRRRWIKGWLQTILVHSRQPITTARCLGTANCVVLLLYFCGIMFSVAVHPIGMLLAVAYLADLVAHPFAGAAIADLIAAAIILSGLAGLASTAFIVYRAAQIRGFAVKFHDFAGIPVYWLGQSVAFWAAAFDLVSRPHHWRKTDHGLVARPPQTTEGEAPARFKQYDPR